MMTKHHYRRDQLQSLLPLLRSITREIEERSAALTELEENLEALSGNPDETREVVAQIATHRRQLRLAQRELERLGCSIVGTTPLTVRIPGRIDGSDRSFVWQRGNPIAY